MKSANILAFSLFVAAVSCRGVEGDLARPAEHLSMREPDEVIYKEPEPRSTRVPAAEARVAAFLDLAVVSRRESARPEFFGCEPETSSQQYLALAASRILSSTRRGDTVVVAAEVVSTAEERQAPHIADKYTVDIRVRTDTLHFPMVKRAEDGAWGVCYRSREGYEFLVPGDPPEIVIWRPGNGSWARVISLADSVRRARR